MQGSAGTSHRDGGIREATLHDAHGIARVHVLSWQTAYRGLVPDEHLDARSVVKHTRFWTDVLNGAPSRGQRIWVSEGAGDIDGFICMGPCRDDDEEPERVGELQAIYLAPAAWRRGIGTALHDVGMDWLRVTGRTKATLWILKGNARALAFYEHHGWRADGSTKHVVWDGTPMDEFRLRIAL